MTKERLRVGASLNEPRSSHIDDSSRTSSRHCQPLEEAEVSDGPLNPTNPWEQLRDHFIGLREQRLSQETSEKSSIEERIDQG